MNKKITDFNKWKEILVDPGVYDLKKSDKYSIEDKIDIKEFLDSLPSNHYFTMDYPSDMNLKYTDLFLKKSWDNAIKYHTHKQYIITVQAKYKNFFSFMEWFDKYNELNIASGILGIGNMCRIHFYNDFMKHSLGYAFKRCNHKRVHIYGLAIRNILPAYKLANKYGIELSVDSTKFTRPINNKISHIYYNKNIKAKERERIYFEEYKRILEKRGVLLLNERRD